MRSSAATFVLAVLALGLGAVATLQLSQSNLNALFGEPPLSPGEPLFDFDLGKVAYVNITNSTGTRATFEWEASHWRMTSPAEDRADYRHLQSLVLATSTLRVQDVIPRNDIDLEQAGYKAGHYEIEILDYFKDTVAHYRLGRSTPWKIPVGREQQLSETYFVRPLDRSDVIYVCSGPNARPLLDAGFEVLRDHRPFLFSGDSLAEIIIRNKSGELVVSRDTLLSQWRISKPLDLRSNPEAVARLVKNLYELEALKVHDPGAVTLPTRTNGDAGIEISLNFQDSDGKKLSGPTLTIEPPATADSTTVYAQVTGREAVFELPLNPAQGHVALSELPLGVDDLRSRTLTSGNFIRHLQSVSVESPELDSPLVLSLGKEHMSGKPRWMITYGPGMVRANEPTVARLFTALTIDSFKAVATDAAADLKPYGLDLPAKRVTITSRQKDIPPTTLLFGSPGEGRYFVMQEGSPTVAEIEYGTWANIATQPFAWRDSILWPHSLIDLSRMRIERPGRPALDLTYNFISEVWTAKRGGKDLTARLNTRRADIMLNKLEEIHVSRWLGPHARDARLRLANPTLTIQATYRATDKDGNPAGERHTLMDLVPASDAPRNQLYYGRISGDLDYFVINRTAYDFLNVELLDQ